MLRRTSLLLGGASAAACIRSVSRVAAAPTPAIAFGGWVSIKHTLDGERAMLMSDTVLLQEEVNPLISAAQDSGSQVTAIHNHFFYESPRIFYMHLLGMGDAAELAGKYCAAIQGTKLHPSSQPSVTASTGGPTAEEIFDLAALDKLVRLPGKVNGPVYKYVIGRDDLQVIAMGAEVTTATTMGAVRLPSWPKDFGRHLISSEVKECRLAVKL